MNRIRAKCDRGVWRVAIVGERDVERSLEQKFGELARILSFPADVSKVWQLELGKSDSALCRTLQSRLDEFVDGCLRAPDQVHELDAWNGQLFRRATLRRLKARGEAVTGLRFRQFRLAFDCVCGSIAASLIIATSAFRLLGERGRDTLHDGTWVAVYGDDSTRDRLAIKALAAESEPCQIVLLGRPRIRISVVKSRLQEQLGKAVSISRPVCAGSLVRCLRSYVPVLTLGIQSVLANDALPSARELSAIYYRVLFGLASAHWQRAHTAPAIVVYSQTGLADTSLLELEQQRIGARTVHLVHGVSLGRNFMGFSDVAVFQCVHDAEWHSLIGGYRSCISDPMEKPTMAATGAGLLLMSNLIHTLNPDFRRRGIEGELELLACVASCVDELNISTDEVTWKPHPSFARQPEATRRAVLDKVAQFGFKVWPHSGKFEDAVGFDVVLSTRSTVLLDLLRIGKLAVLVDVVCDNEISATAVSRMPLIARNKKQLVACINAIRNGATATAAYDQAWNAIGPGKTDLTLVRLAQLATHPRQEC